MLGGPACGYQLGSFPHPPPITTIVPMAHEQSIRVTGMEVLPRFNMNSTNGEPARSHY